MADVAIAPVGEPKVRKPREPSVRSTERAELHLSVARVSSAVKDLSVANRVSDVFPVALTACLERTALEILAQAALRAGEEGRKRVTVDDVCSALKITHLEALNCHIPHNVFNAVGPSTLTYKRTKKDKAEDGEAEAEGEGEGAAEEEEEGEEQ